MLFRSDLQKSKSFEDSLKLAKKLAEQNKSTDSTKKSTAKKEDPKYIPEETWVKVFYKKDIPSSAILLKGARIITMKGDEVINGDVLVVNNRIQSVGKGIKTPAGTKVIDVAGKTIVPGFVDVHSHMWPTWGIHKTQVWIYAANLEIGRAHV